MSPEYKPGTSRDKNNPGHDKIILPPSTRLLRGPSDTADVFEVTLQTPAQIVRAIDGFLVVEVEVDGKNPNSKEVFYIPTPTTTD